MTHTFSPTQQIAIFIDHENPSNPFVTANDITYSGPLVSVTIPAGFVHDGASVPRIFWWLMPRVGRWSRAALVHDYLYRTHVQGVNKAVADAIFLSIMEYDNVGWLTRTLMFKAVSLFGGSAWRG